MPALTPELGSPHIIEEQHLDAAVIGIHNVKKTIETNKEGYILGRRHGVATYENDSLVSMAARDEGELVVAHP